MTSTFTWLDYSEHERRKMLDVIALFDERTTRDELGLGGVRDAFADRLFPGNSTIQTVAKHFLFVPWIHLHLEQIGHLLRLSGVEVGNRKSNWLDISPELLVPGQREAPRCVMTCLWKHSVTNLESNSTG